MKRGLIYTQLVLFLVIGVGSGYYVVNDVVGPSFLHAPTTVSVKLDDDAGLGAGAEVTERGVVVGTVSAVQIDDTDPDVTLSVSLNPGVRIPADSTAAITMDTPVDIEHLDFQPTNDTPPYLHDGSEIDANHTSRPLPLETLLNDFMQLANSLNPQDITTLADALATGLNNSGPELQQIENNATTLVTLLKQQQGNLDELTGGGIEGSGTNLLNSVRNATDTLPALTQSLHQLGDALVGQTPAIDSLLDTGPDLVSQLVPLLADNQGSIGALLGSLVTTSQIVSARIPALHEALISIPAGLNDLAGVVHGDVADFYLVGTQGPVCANNTQRRPPTETAPTQPVLGWQCPSNQPTLSQCGAANAPRPGDPQITTYNANTGDTADANGNPIQLGSSGGQSSALGANSWSAILLQGVQ